MPDAFPTPLLCRLTAGIVLGRWDVVRAARAEADPAPDRAWREAVLQTHLFAGFPRLVEAYGVLGEVGGLGDPDPDETPGEPDRPERGRELFDRIYGGVADAVRGTLQNAHGDFARWIEGHAYGRVLTRPGLDPDRREELAVACLAALGQDRQLMSHARGALRLGSSPERLRAALDAIEDFVDPDALARARRIVERVAGEAS